MPCFLTEAAPRACTRRRSIAMATSCHLALCWLYSKEIEAQVDSNPRRTRNQRRSPGARELQSVAATSPERRTHKVGAVYTIAGCCAHPERPRRRAAEQRDETRGVLYLTWFFQPGAAGFLRNRESF